jgi:hypothetical protein
METKGTRKFIETVYWAINVQIDCDKEILNFFLFSLMYSSCYGEVLFLSVSESTTGTVKIFI